MTIFFILLVVFYPCPRPDGSIRNRVIRRYEGGLPCRATMACA